MNRIIFLSALFVCLSSTANTKFTGNIGGLDLTLPEIVNEGNVSINSYNFLASVTIYFESWTPAGAAVIINNKWLLTAATNVMFELYRSVRVRVGSNYTDQEGNLLDIDKYVVYPTYGEGDESSNLALIKLKQPLQFSQVIGPAPFGSKLPVTGESTSSLGFGSSNISDTVTGHLKMAEISFLDAKSCQQYYPHIDADYNYCTTSSTIGPCLFDWGGPLLYNDEVVGLYSYSDECDIAAMPAVYVDITQPKYAKWIVETIRKD